MAVDYRQEKQEKVAEVVEKTMNMELICVTPHGHQVYRYRDEDRTTTWVYVLVRHADGYPIALTTH